MGKIVLGLALLLIAIAVFVATVMVELAWLGFCLGTVVVGIVLLVFAPSMLLLPLNLGIVAATFTWAAGITILSSDKVPVNTELADAIDRFNKTN